VSDGTVTLTGWGRATATPSLVSHERTSEAVSDLVRHVLAEPARTRRGLLARGLGRSYGDAALNAGGRVVRTDALTGTGDVGEDGEVDVMCGTSIGELLEQVVPQGWFVPVTPGTRHVTLGGAVAADVHGKNHHRDGSLARHITELSVVDGRGEVRTLTPADPAFDGVVGGMGLTGIVTRVRLRLRAVGSDRLTVHTVRTADLDATMSALEAADRAHRYTVAWLDTLAPGRSLGRGVLTSGDHTRERDPAPGSARTLRQYRVGPEVPAPPWAPSGLLTARRMRLFNELYYRRAPEREVVSQESIASFFHPLDRVRGWNRMYGRAGFLQYQFVVPDAVAVREVLELFRDAGVPGFLAVLKRFGPASGPPLSFPAPGWTLAVDMPAHPELTGVLDRADDVVVEHGGRVYLAKDSRMRPGLLPRMYPDIDRWREQRELLDPHHLFTSDLARRLHL
jgi:decaprenylphospho-beta-D-ribofuranose 2-oxidase